jgi:L-rhamnose isomerase
MQSIEQGYEKAKQKYAQFDVDTNRILEILQKKPISIHCWQGDDVTGFENKNVPMSGGIMATGNYPGKARNVEELWGDLEKVLELVPGTHRVNIHAMYGKFDNFSDRNSIEIEHYHHWIDWGKSNNIKIDFNPTLFSHPQAENGFTLSSKDPEIRSFWISHVERCREIADFIGKRQKSPCIHNLWIPDGMKDVTIDRYGYRAHLKESLDKIYQTKYPNIKDSLESKLFGLGSETYVVGSHDFYLAYAIKNKIMLCLDLGHYHPTESLADKISSILHYCKELLLHISRGVRWDSDHIPINSDQTRELFLEITRSKTIDRVYLALDYFDASINRIGAWVTGIRSAQKSLLEALLEPTQMLIELEENGKYFERIALLEEMKTMPIGAVWDYFCLNNNVLTGTRWIKEIQVYEKNVLSKRK